ncbi:MAG TPA: aldo/keto reductase [Chloroflexia bacterium]|nr:aldo/keto reductase [Chloroflexia bacterium]
MAIPRQPFGRSGHDSTRTIFGAAALWSVTQKEADPTLDVLLEYGINHIDVAASYGDAEVRIAPWLARHPGRFYLATKTGERTAAGAREDLHRSLERMGVDRVDLWQLHNLGDPDEWEIAMGPGGALEAAVAAKAEGLVGAIGVTGHGLGIAALHRRALERFDFDSVLLPYNWLIMHDPTYAMHFEALLATCRERNVAVQTIKGITAGPWGDREHSRATWYAPLEDQRDIDTAVSWVLGRPGVFLNTAGDIHVLPRILDAARRYQAPPTDGDMQALVERAQMEPLFV